jgi:hypothetical protein
VNAGLAKPIPQYLVYSMAQSCFPRKRLLQRGGLDRHKFRMAKSHNGATIGRDWLWHSVATHNP